MLERAILRLAAYELLWEPEVPPAVVIDEAVRIRQALLFRRSRSPGQRGAWEPWPGPCESQEAGA